MDKGKLNFSNLQNIETQNTIQLAPHKWKTASNWGISNICIPRMITILLLFCSPSSFSFFVFSVPFWNMQDRDIEAETDMKPQCSCVVYSGILLTWDPLGGFQALSWGLEMGVGVESSQQDWWRGKKKRRRRKRKAQAWKSQRKSQPF